VRGWVVSGGGGVRIKVDFDMSKVVGWVNAMTNQKLDQAKASALNKVVAQAKTEMGREIVKEFNVTSAYVRERLVVRRASAAAQRFVMEATLAAAGKRRAANMIRFVERSTTLAQARKRMAGGEGGTHTLRGGGQITKALELRFKIKRSGDKKIVKGAFIGNKGRTVFIREGSGRLPIKALQTVDVPQMFNAKRINAKVVAFMKAKLPQVLERELKYFMSK
jgi:hypothetical protein